MAESRKREDSQQGTEEKTARGEDLSRYVFDWRNPNMTAGTTEKASSRADERADESGMTEKKTPKKSTGRGGAGGRKETGRSAAAGKRSGSTARSGSEHRKASGGSGKRRKKTGVRRLRALLNRALAVIFFAAFLALLIWGFSRLLGVLNGEKTTGAVDYDTLPDYVTEEYLTVNSYSRPGISLSEVNGIVIHYTANPGTTAQQNRDYFEGLAESGETRASSHFVIGIDGEVIACVPLGELAYASNSRNTDTISIECCHEDETGEFTEATYESLVKLTVWLCGKYDLQSGDVIRHYDITGKSCPKYFVDNPDAWTAFLGDVADGLQ